MSKGNILTDLHLAVRKLHRHPRSAMVVILTLSLGIGATTALATVIYKVLVEPLPYLDPESLVAVESLNLKREIEHGRTSIGDFVDWRRQAQSFSGLEAVGPFSAVLTGAGPPEEVPGAVVSAGFFSTLGVRPILGRDFRAEEEVPGRDQILLLSHAFWKRRFGADPGAVGKKLLLDGERYEIVGVLPADFWWHGPEVAVWSPLALGPQNLVRQRRGLTLIGRLRPAVPLAEAHTEMKGLAALSAELYPDTNRGWTARVEPLARKWTREVESTLLLLLAATSAVLAIACLNVVAILLARSAEQHRELAIRTALGSPRWPLLRQQAAEALVFSFAGGAGGLLLTYWSIEALVSLAPRRIPRIEDVALGPPTVLFTLGLSLLIGLVLAGVVMWYATRADLRAALTGSREGSSNGRRWTRFGDALIVAEIAVALPLTLATGLLVESLAKLGEVDPGFQPSGVAIADLFLPPGRYPEDNQLTAFSRRLIESLNDAPGVQTAAMTSALPLHTPALVFERPLRISGAPTDQAESLAAVRIVSPGLFRALGMRLLAGRDFTWNDGFEAPLAAVVNQSLAQAMWPDRSPIGETLWLDYRGEQDIEVVGILDDVRYESLESSPVPEIYLAAYQFPVLFSTLAVRSEPVPPGSAEDATVNPETLWRLIETRVWDLDPELTMTLGSFDDVMAQATRQRRFTLALLGVFATLALTLTAIGIYGLMAYTVNRRTPEIGLRMALGARPAVILGEIFRWGGGLALLGMVLGGAAAWGGSKWLASFLFGVGPNDVLLILSTPILLLFVALLGSLVPALTAMRVEPTRALRHDS